MIELKNISKKYQNSHQDLWVLKNINLSVPRGHIMGVIGESGAGKSSLIRCINLLEKPDEGEVWVKDKSLMALSEAELRKLRRCMGFVSQHCNFLSHATVYENIALPLVIAGYAKERINSIVDSLLGITGLESQAYQYPSQLSGGQKQRVNIARALALKPRILLCDEATSALDPQATHCILKLLKKLQQEFALTILLITHEIDVIKSICDEVTLLSKGCILEQSSVLQFFTSPQTDLGRSFVKKALHHTLPEILEKKLSNVQGKHTVLRISFCGHMTHEPIVSYLSQGLGLHFSIIQSHIERIQYTSFGVMFVQTADEASKVQAGINYLKDKGVPVELIGYVD